MTGGWIEKYPDDVKAIAKAGHELGNHSENHKQMSKLSAEECKDEIMKPHNKVKNLTGKEMLVFRPPYGDYNDTLIETVESCNYHAIQWDVDTLVIKRKIMEMRVEKLQLFFIPFLLYYNIINCYCISNFWYSYYCSTFYSIIKWNIKQTLVKGGNYNE